MRMQVQKWGNSLAIRILKFFAKETNIEQSLIVNLSAVEGKLITKPIEENEYSLEELLAAVTESPQTGYKQAGRCPVLVLSPYF